MIRKKFTAFCLVAGLILTGITLSPPAWGADAAGLNPGNVIDASNLNQYKDYLSTGVEALVANQGHVLNIGESKTFPHNPKYKEFTAQYSSQVTLDPETDYFSGYTRGQPFPNVDADDPEAGPKIGYNVEYRLRPDELIYEYTDLVFRGKDNNIERTLNMKVRQLYFTGRAVLPEIENPEQVRWQEFVGFSDPLDVAGVAFLIKRYLDPGKIDDSWAYIPAVRRIRRMASAQRSDPLLGSDWSLEDMYCYNDKVEDQTWKLIDKRKMYLNRYASVTEGRNVKWGGTNGWSFREQPHELRDVYVIEGTPKRSRHPYSKRVMYIDTEWFDTPQVDTYDNKGELWKILFQSTCYDPDHQMLNWPFANAVDVQNSHCTPVLYKIAINDDTEKLGGITPEEFSTSTLKKYGYGRLQR